MSHLSVAEFAKLVDRSKSHIKYLCQHKAIQGVTKDESNGRWLIPADSLWIPEKRGRKPGMKTSPIRNIIKVRLQRESICVESIAKELDVTRQLITLYLRELGAKKNTLTGLYSL